MGEKKEYRSAVRSRKLIRRAFMDLLKEKSFEKITVTDIVNLAEINRSTFYAHYPDVLGLIEEIQIEVVDYMQNVLGGIDFKDFLQNPKPVLNEIVKMTEENNELYRLLADSNIAVKQLTSIKNILIERTLKSIEIPDIEGESFEKEFVVRFFTGGVVDIYLEWLSGEIDCTIDEITEELAKVIMRFSKGYFE